MPDNVNVKFRRGTQANLNTIIQSNGGTGDRFVDGTFYLTTDTDKLYVAQSDSELVLLNGGIRNVSTVPSSLTNIEAGDFYYVTSSNMLITKVNAADTAWTQVNPDTYLTANNQHNRFESITGGVKVTSDIVDTYGGSSSTYHHSIGTMSIVGAGSATVTQSNGVITITGGAINDTQYVLTASSNKLILTPSVGTAQEISLAGGASGLATLTSSGNTITVDVPTQTLTLGFSFNSSGVLNLSAQSNFFTTTATNSVTPIIQLDTSATEAGDGKYKFVSGTASLPVYTKSEVDSAINTAKAAMNAMTYLGTVSSSDASTKIVGTANVGDTYKASEAITKTAIMEKAAATGDLLIAKGTDGNVTWDVIPSGDDQVLSMNIPNHNRGFTLYDSTNASSLGGLTIAAGTHMAVTGTMGNNNVATVTIAQAADYGDGQGGSDTITGSTANVTQATGETKTFTAITEMEVDAYGNVVLNSVKTKTLTVVDTHANITNVTPRTSIETAGSNKATIAIQVADTDTNKTGSFYLQSSSLAVTCSNNTTVDVNLVWGEF